MEELLLDLYLKQNWTVQQIADSIGKSRITTSRLLNKYNLKKQERYEEFIDITRLIELKENGYSHKEISSIMGITVNQSKKCYIANTKKSNHKVNETLVDKQDKNFWYLIGLFLADGHVDKNKNSIKISQKNPQILNKIRKYFRSEGKLYKGKVYTLTLYSPKLYSYLEEFNLTGNKTYTCDLPNVPMEFMSYFLRGYMDGDGWIYYNYVSGTFKKIEIGFVTGSYNLARSLSTYLKEYSASLSKEKDSIYRVTVQGESNVLQLGDFIYQDLDSSFYIEEKYTKFLKLKDILNLNNNYKIKI